MEKFSGWTDEATGVNPFVQRSRRLPTNIIKKIGKVLMQFVLCV